MQATALRAAADTGRYAYIRRRIGFNSVGLGG